MVKLLVNERPVLNKREKAPAEENTSDCPVSSTNAHMTYTQTCAHMHTKKHKEFRERYNNLAGKDCRQCRVTVYNYSKEQINLDLKRKEKWRQ